MGLLLRQLLALAVIAQGACGWNDTTAMLQVSVQASLGGDSNATQAEGAIRQHLEEFARLSAVSRMLAAASSSCGEEHKEAQTLQKLTRAAANLRAEMEALLEASPNCGAINLAREVSPEAPARLAGDSCALAEATGATVVPQIGPSIADNCFESGQIFGARTVGCMWPNIHLSRPAELPLPAEPLHRRRMHEAALNKEVGLEEGPGRGKAKQTPAIPGLAPNATIPQSVVLTERKPLWLFVNLGLALFALGIMFCLIVWCSPLRGAHFQTDESTNTVMLGGGISQRLVQVCLPYWVPVTRETTGYFFLLSFLSLCCTCLSLGYLWLLFVLRLSLWVQPDVFQHFVGSSFRPQAWFNWRLITAALAGTTTFPLFYLAWRSKLQGRELQWCILGFKLFFTFNGMVSALPMSYLGRAQNNWIVLRQADEYWHWVRVMSGVNLALGIFFGVLSKLTGKALEIKWRRYMTSYLMDRYMDQRAYYMLNSNSGRDFGADNPDARIQGDVSGMMSSIIVFLFSVLDLISGMINSLLLVWTILPAWTMAAVGYTMFGSVFSLWFAWQFTRLSYEIQKKEADWRFSLVNLRTNAEAIAFYGGEQAERQRTDWRFEAVQEFSIRTMWWGMGFGFYHAFYDAGIQLVPGILLTRMYFQERLDYGGMQQFQGAFSGFVGNLSFILDHSGMIASVSTAVTRLGGLMERIEDLQMNSGIKIDTIPEGRLVVRDLTVRTPDLKVELLRNLSFSMGGKREPLRVLVVGPSGVGKSSLMRAIAGLWAGGSGQVERPENSDCMFLPQHPYMPLGSLRDQLLYPDVTQFVDKDELKGAESDSELMPLLEELHLGDLPGRFAGGLDHVDDWSRLLSRGEQQRVAVVRCMVRKPAFVVLDEATSALAQSDEDVVYRRFRALGFPYLSVGHHMGLVDYHDAVLELLGGDSWEMHTKEEFKEILKKREELREIANESL